MINIVRILEWNDYMTIWLYDIYDYDYMIIWLYLQGVNR